MADMIGKAMRKVGEWTRWQYHTPWCVMRTIEKELPKLAAEEPIATAEERLEVRRTLVRIAAMCLKAEEDLGL